jgi:hypothetical protein
VEKRKKEERERERERERPKGGRREIKKIIPPSLAKPSRMWRSEEVLSLNYERERERERERYEVLSLYSCIK